MFRKPHKLDVAIETITANIQAWNEVADSHPILAGELRRRTRSFRAALRILKSERAADRRRDPVDPRARKRPTP